MPASVHAGPPPEPVVKQVPVVALRNVTRRFPGVVANDDVSIEIYPGEVHVLLGENGAGKSTLVAMLSGLYVPDEGYVEIDGRRVLISSPRQALSLGIGTVFQHSMLVPGLSVSDNFALGGIWWKRPDRDAIAANIKKTAERVGLRVDPGALVRSLSLGERQQMEILRALMRGSRCLILDEATAMLTPDEAVALGDLIRRLATEGFAVVFITHKLKEAISYGDRISVLRRGCNSGEIDPDTLRNSTETVVIDRIVAMMFGPSKGGDDEGRVHSARSFGDIVLEVDGLATGKGRIRLSDVNLSVRAGEILGIAGIDGNGQRELAEALSGQLPSDAGFIRIRGRDVTDMPVRERRHHGLRYVTDDRLGEGTVGSFPVAINFLLKDIGAAPFWRRGTEVPREIQDQAERLIDSFDIRTPSPWTPAGKLSGGNIQKVMLARELTGAAGVIIFSKPTTGLDINNTRAVRRRIREAADSGRAVLLISTDLDELLELADRIAVLDRGRVCGVVDNGSDAREAVGRLLSAGGDT